MKQKTHNRLTGFFNDFRQFINKGNVLDMAVGVIVGGAFSKVVSSLVSDVITPLLGLLTGQVAFADLKWTLRAAEVAEDGTVIAEAITLGYGQFLQNVLDFLLVSSCIFFAVRIFAKLRAVQERLENDWKEKLAEKGTADAPTEAAAEEPAPAEAAPSELQPSAEALLLTEIRDLLKQSASRTTEDIHG